MNEHMRTITVLDEVITELGLPTPASIYVHVFTDARTVSAVYQEGTADLPPLDWQDGGIDGSIPFYSLERDGVHIAIQAHRTEAVAA